MDKSYPFVYTDELATKARATLRDYGLRVLPVLNENRKLAGVVTRNDVMAITSSVSPIQVRGVMSQPKFVATPTMEINQTARRMIKLDEWYIPVVSSTQNLTYKGMLGLENFLETALQKGMSGLSKSLSDVMSSQVVTCSPEDEVDNVWRLMREKSFAGLPVVKKGRLIGIITEKDLLDSGAIFPAFEATKGRFKSPPKIMSVMKTNVVSLKPTSTVEEAAKIMLEKNFGRIPVVDEKGKLVGIVDREDIVRSLL